jgi:hypothetical protein
MAPVAAELPRTSSEPRVPCTRSISSATSPSRPVSNTAKKKKKKEIKRYSRDKTAEGRNVRLVAGDKSFHRG